MMNFMQTKGGIHMIINGNPRMVAKTDKHYADVVNAINNKATPDEILAILDADKIRFEQAVQVVEGIELKAGELYYDGEVIAGVLGERMKQMLDEGFDLKPMAAFLKNLMDNPSQRVVEHLYAFLDHGKCPITEDGCFLTYKAVRADFKDIHSGTFDNSVGQVVSMRRNRVDEDPHRTCSAGLHVCSFEYLPYFSHADGHVMVCKVNPAHVVAIPADYNNTKMRVCQYTVVDEYKGYYNNQGDALGSRSVAAGSTDEPFEVLVDRGNGFEVEESFARLSAAAELAEDLSTNSDVRAVSVKNVLTGAILSSEVNPDFEDDELDPVIMDEPTYAVFGVYANGTDIELSSGHDSVKDALQSALDVQEELDGGSNFYARIEVRNEDDGEVVKTLS